MFHEQSSIPTCKKKRIISYLLFYEIYLWIVKPTYNPPHTHTYTYTHVYLHFHKNNYNQPNKPVIMFKILE